MARFTVGVVMAALWLALGCGKTDAKGGSASGGAVGAGGDSSVGAVGGSKAAGGRPGTAGAGNAASAGGPVLPPDGEVPPAVTLDKLDLLLMVDNSSGTAEKQRLLLDAVKSLVTEVSLSISDLHVGVITSSLGSHGASGARDVCVQPDDDDHAHLLATLRPNVPSFEDRGFLAWGPDTEPALDVVLGQLEPTFAAIGEVGCGYEASLEAWYRFLVMPDPPLSVVLDGTLGKLQGIDQTLLAQRAEFLRRDSVLAIVVLSDENDCSIVDEGYGWLVSRSEPMFRSTSVCDSNPNDECCQSCGESETKRGCEPISFDLSCQKSQTLMGEGEDDLNLRCWQQQRRFGFDLLHPIQRYTDALTRQFVFDRDDNAMRNPLFAGEATRRHPSQVILTGIVGLPWQDVADETSLSGPGLELLSASELDAQGRWDVMLGDPAASPPVLPTDPFMLETTTDRAALSSVHSHPLVPSQTLVPSSSTNPGANSINGHESADDRRRLQAACIFPLLTPRICDETARDANLGCSCYQDDLARNSALCQPPGGGNAGTLQYFESAYPGTRHLQLLQSLGDTAITASACPKVLSPTDPDHGYRPAMRALAARLQRAFEP